jgi:hypothetical protein
MHPLVNLTVDDTQEYFYSGSIAIKLMNLECIGQ